MCKPIACVLAGLSLAVLAGPAAGGKQELGIRSCRVQAVIGGRVADSAIELTFANYTTAQREVAYQFRLPAAATVHDLTLWVDGVPMPGEVLLSRHARAIYESIVNARRDPAILEKVGPGLWRLCVFPVMPGKTMRVSFHATHLLPVKDNAIEYAVPAPESCTAGLVAQEMDFSAVVERPGWGRAPVIRAGKRPLGVTSTEEGVKLGWTGQNVDLADPVTVTMLPGDSAPEVAYDSSTGGFVADLAVWNILPRPAAKGRDVVIVYDSSESMAAPRREVAEQAAAKVLRSLGKDDRFALAIVRSDVKLWRAGLSPAGKADVEAALAFLGHLKAEGGTDLAAGLRAAEALNAGPGRRHDVFVISDACDSVGALSAVEAAATPAPKAPAPAKNLRAYGIYLGWVEPEQADLAERTGGSSVWLSPGSDMSVDWTGLDAMLAQAAQAAPPTVNVAVPSKQFNPVTKLGWRLSVDGERLFLAGHVSGWSELPVKLSTQIDGKTVEKEYVLKSVDSGRSDAGIGRLQAALTAESDLDAYEAKPESPDRLAEILNDCMEAGLVTRRTSLLVLENDAEYAARGIARRPSRLEPGETFDDSKVADDKTPDKADLEALEARAEELRGRKQYEQESLVLGMTVARFPHAFESVRRLAIVEAFLDDQWRAGLGGDPDSHARRQRWATTPWSQSLRRDDLADLVPVPFEAPPAYRHARDFYSPERILGPANHETWKKLNAKVAKVEFQDAALKDVIQWMRETVGVPVRMNAAALGGREITQDTRVSFRLENATGHEIVQAVLKSLSADGRTGTWMDEGAVVFTTDTEAGGKVVRRTYDVRDFVADAGQTRLYARYSLLDTGPFVAENGSGLFGGGGRGGTSGLFGSSSQGDTSASSGEGERKTVGSVEGPQASVAGGGGSEGGQRVFDVRDMLVAVPNFVGPRIDIARLGQNQQSSNSSGLFGSVVSGSGRGDDSAAIPDMVTDALKGIQYEADVGRTLRMEMRDGVLIVNDTPAHQVAVLKTIYALREKMAAARRQGEGTDLREAWPEALFTFDGRLNAWVVDLLAAARNGTLSKFSSVVVRPGGGRTFARIGGVWFDTSLSPQATIALIAPRSSAAASLARQCPQAKPCFAVGPYVIVAAPDAKTALCLDPAGVVDAEDPFTRKIIDAFVKGWTK